MFDQTIRFSEIAGGKIDRDKGIISGVSVITMGDAKGHGIKVDKKTLESVFKVASEFSNGVKVKLRHRQSDEHQSVVEASAGVLKNFSIDGNKVRADFHVFNSLKKETKEMIYELAETIPDQFGFSIDFSGVTEVIGDEKFARCQELQSIDLSDAPAANDGGLFSAMCELCKGHGCMGHTLEETQRMYDATADASSKQRALAYALKYHGKHLSDPHDHSPEKHQQHHKSMSAPTNEELALSISKLAETVNTLTAKLESAPAALSYKDDKGNVVQLSAQNISTALSEAKKLADDASKANEETLRQTIIRQMSAEGRVPMNPDTKKGYTLAELNAMSIPTLQFAAVNSPVIPLAAQAVYRGDKAPKVDPAVKGSDRVLAAWSEKYSNLEQMLAQPISTGQTL